MSVHCVPGYSPGDQFIGVCLDADDVIPGFLISYNFNIGAGSFLNSS
jgi:hypothetical protein